MADPLGAPGSPGIGPHGAPLGVVPGVSFGFTVDGLVLLPGVGEFGELDPGTVDGLVLPGGVDVPAGGVAVPGV